MTNPTSDQIIAIARLFLPLREAQSLGQNQGQRVNAVQMWSGGESAIGTSWCAWWATMVLDLAFAFAAPIMRMGSCERIRQVAIQKGWITTTPSIGDLFLYTDESGLAHHVGFVTIVDPLTGIAGNTSADGASANGNGVYEHEIHASTFIHYPRG